MMELDHTPLAVASCVSGALGPLVGTAPSEW
jgi:hypothetical protein